MADRNSPAVSQGSSVDSYQPVTHSCGAAFSQRLAEGESTSFRRRVQASLLRSALQSKASAWNELQLQIHHLCTGDSSTYRSPNVFILKVTSY